MRDFNIDLFKQENHPLIADYFRSIIAKSCVNIIDKATRMTTNSATLLDHIYTNLNNNVESGILIYEIFDHLPTFCSISSKPLQTKTKYKFRDIKSFDKEKFIGDISILEEKVNHGIHTQRDTEATVAFFTENFSQFVNKYASQKESSRKEAKLKTKP